MKLIILYISLAFATRSLAVPTYDNDPLGVNEPEYISDLHVTQTAGSGDGNELPKQYLENWMRVLRSYIGHTSLLDLAMPGTHDTLTYDLSDVLADNANSMPPWVSKMIHDFQSVISLKKVGAFVKEQAVTQGLTISDQLNQGIRYIDFRMTWSTGPGKNNHRPYDWWSVHLMESNQTAKHYFQQIKDWLSKHKEEIVMITVSRHGNLCPTGEDQWPGASPEVKQAMWAQLKQMFDGMIFNPSEVGGLNKLTYNDMIGKGKQVVFYTADHAEFTGNDTMAYDACKHISNYLMSKNLNDVPGYIDELQTITVNASQIREDLKAKDTLFLLSMAGSPPGNVLSDQAEAHFLRLFAGDFDKKCAKNFDLPGIGSKFCPDTLLDIEQMRNFYTQQILYSTVTNATQHELPGAIYLDAVDFGGLFRTGTSTNYDPTLDIDNSLTRGYAYVDTMLLYNVRKGCASLSLEGNACHRMLSRIRKQIEKNPEHKWNDPQTGRDKNFP
eukprot:Clim_evm155s210 gene=Clim_evmTU155s210